MARLGSFKSLVRRFEESRDGAVAVTIGIAVIPMMMAAGVALDFVHASALKTKLQSALDSAALAAASAQDLSDKERIDVANKVFAENWQDKMTKDIPAMPDFSVIKDKGIQGSAAIKMPTALMRIVGINTMDVGSDVTISIPEGTKAEVVLSLDYSKSMTEVSGGKVKYVAMRDAATKLVNDLATAAKGRFKIGLVPFSHQVYLTLPKQYVLGQSGSGTWTNCTVDRQYPYNTTDDTPTSANGSKWGQPQDPSHIVNGCSGYAPRNLKLVPLTDDYDAVTNQLSIMKPYEWTHIALGAEFGWHVLSPNAPFTGAASYSDKITKKFMVLLTDGRQTEPAFGPSGSRSVSRGEKNLEKICDGMKKDGITIITVAYDLQDTATRDRLRNCSTDPDKDFFVAEDEGDVASAFEQIKTQIAAKIYISE
jgi:Putative Flp pilus-assembly TadE/G-like/von Willebrand factor type A domain